MNYPKIQGARQNKYPQKPKLLSAGFVEIYTVPIQTQFILVYFHYK